MLCDSVEVTEASPAPTQSNRSTAARLTKVISLVLASIAPPLILVTLLFGPRAAGGLILPAMVGIFGVLMGSPRVGLMASILMILIGPVAAIAGQVAITGAAIMGLACIGVGVSAGWGLQRALSMIPMTMAFLMVNPPPLSDGSIDRTSSTYLFAVMLILAIGSLWSTAVLTLMTRQAKLPKPPPNTRADTIEYLTIITVLCSAATFVVLTLQPGPDAFWLILTLLVVVQVGNQETRRKTLDRVGGTILGAALAAALVTVVHAPWVLTLVAILCVLASVYFATGPRYWLYMSFMTPAIVLSAGAATAVSTAEARVLYTVVGGALAMIAIGISDLIRKSGHNTNFPAATG